MKKIRTIQVVNVRWFNATAWYGLFLARLLEASGNPTIVLGLPDTASFAKAGEWGLNCRALPLNSSNPLELTQLIKQLRQIIREFKPDVVNCHRGEGFLLWPLLRDRQNNFALVRTRGDQRAPKNNLPNRILYGSATNAVIATNSLTANVLREELGVAPEKIHTIIGGVDEGTFYPDKEAGQKQRQSLGFSRQDFVVGLLGRLDPVKGHKVLIEALGKLKAASGSDFRLRFLCIGDNAVLERENIIELLRRADIEQETIITGRVDNIRDYINALDLGVLASVSSEAIARAALEIMACNVPLLSSDVGVMPDILPLRWLIPKNNSDFLAEAIYEYSSNAESLARLQNAGHKALKGLGSQDFLKKTLQVYHNCLRAF